MQKTGLVANFSSQKYLNFLRLARRRRALLFDGEDGLFGEAHEGGGTAHDEDGEAPELVVGQVAFAEGVAHLGEEEGGEAHDPLEAEEEDGAEAEPAVQRVHVGDGRGGQVVRVEDGLEGDGGEDEDCDVHHSVHDFHRDFGGVLEESVDEDGCRDS